MKQPLFDVRAMYEGSWSNRASHRISIARTHVAAGRMLTPSYHGQLPHSFAPEFTTAPVDEQWEQETLEWLRNCCQGLWRLDLMENVVMKMSGQYTEQAWHVRFERHSDAILYKLARL